MLKRLTVALAALFVLSAQAFAAGTIPGISMTQQLDKYAKPLAGGFLYLIQAGTTSTPQNCYQDTALSIPWPNPITLDAAGRIPQLFCADGNIKIRLTDVNGVTQIVQDNLLVVGASSGGGGGGTVDATTILATGDMKITYGTGVLSGFVRANGRTIGSATSGATERANSDTQALFLYLWGADANLAVSTGRGVSAAADWAANKTITLPDMRGRVMAGLDDMGNSAASRLTSSYFGSGATTLGSSSGSESSTLVTGNLPAYTPSGTFSGSTARNVVSAQTGSGVNIVGVTTAGGSAGATSDAANTTLNQVVVSGSITGVAQGGTSTPFVNLPPMMLITMYIKL